MDGAMGDGSKWFALPATSGALDFVFQCKKGGTDIHNPGPSDCYVMLDENPMSNDDATFYTNPKDATGTGTGTFTELPGAMHGNACGMVFADGHSEVHMWKDPQTTPAFNGGYTSYLQGVSVSNNKDLVWLAQHTPLN